MCMLHGTPHIQHVFSYVCCRVFMARVTRRMAILTHRKLLNGQQLLQVLYFMSRLSKHHPPVSFLNDWCSAFQPYIPQTPPGVLSDVLLCLASLQYSPRPAFARDLLWSMTLGTHHHADTSSNTFTQSAGSQLASREAAQQLYVQSADDSATSAANGFSAAGRNEGYGAATVYKSLETMLGPGEFATVLPAVLYQVHVYTPCKSMTEVP